MRYEKGGRSRRLACGRGRTCRLAASIREHSASGERVRGARNGDVRDTEPGRPPYENNGVEVAVLTKGQDVCVKTWNNIR